jgi:hypothetical protein
MSDSTPGASIYYTTDGTTPTTGSTTYSTALTISSTETVKAIATASGYTESDLASAVYTILPTLTGLNYTSLYFDGLTGSATVTITGTGFQQGGKLSLTSFATTTLGAGPWGTEIDDGLTFNVSNMNPGWKTFQYCQPDGTCSNMLPFLLVGPNNTLAVDYVNGELYNYAPAGTGAGNFPPALVYPFKISGTTLTPGTNFSISYAAHDITYDSTSMYVMVAQDAGGPVGLYTSDGVPVNSNASSGSALSVAAYDGEGCATQPTGNFLSCFIATQSGIPSGEITLDNQPSALAMGPVEGATSVLVLERDVAPALEKLNPNGGSIPIPETSVALAGFTPISTLQASQPYAGGWYEALNNGTSATLSSADNLAIFINASSMQEVSSTAFTQPAYLLAPDTAHGTFIVQLPYLATSANLANNSAGTSGFASLNPTTGKLTKLTSTSTLFGGLAVSTDGTTLYVCSGSKCETQPNQ